MVFGGGKIWQKVVVVLFRIVDPAGTATGEHGEGASRSNPIHEFRGAVDGSRAATDAGTVVQVYTTDRPDNGLVATSGVFQCPHVLH